MRYFVKIADHCTKCFGTCQDMKSVNIIVLSLEKIEYNKKSYWEIKYGRSKEVFHIPYEGFTDIAHHSVLRIYSCVKNHSWENDTWEVLGIFAE